MTTAVASLPQLSDPSAIRSLVRRVRALFAPPPTLTVSQFADAEILLPSSSAVPGRWRTDYAPYERGILDAFHELGVQTVVVMGSSQFGKTTCAVVVVSYHIAHLPCPILVVEPTLDMAKDFAQNRLDPIVAASPALTNVVSKKRAKDASNTMLAKVFKGGSIAIGGANSAASLAARSVRLLVLDEIDRYPPDLPGEGNPIAIALKRTTAFGRRARRLLLSSPTLKDGPVDTWFHLGDQRRYHVPCPACGAMFVYQWKQVRWTDGDPTTARIHCPSCDYGLDDVERIAVQAHGDWVAAAPDRRDRSIVSVHMWEAYSPMSSLAAIVSGFLQARADMKRGDKSTMHTWENTTLGEPLEPEQGEGLESSALLVRREAYTDEVPAGACVLTLAIDTQDEWLEALIAGWGPSKECWLIDHVRLDGDTSQPEVWAAAGELLDRQYRHPSGVLLSPQATCIDSAGHRTTMVYDWVAPRAGRRVFAIIGRDGRLPIVGRPSPRRWGRSQRQVNLYTVGVDAAKALVMSRLKLENPGPGFIHLPLAEWCDQEFVDQLTSERLVTHFTKGVPVQTWQKTRVRNEALDLVVYNMAAIELARPNFPALAARLGIAVDPDAPAKPPPAAPPAPVAPPKQPWITRRPGGWMQKGRR